MRNTKLIHISNVIFFFFGGGVLQYDNLFYILLQLYTGYNPVHSTDEFAGLKLAIFGNFGDLFWLLIKGIPPIYWSIYSPGLARSQRGQKCGRKGRKSPIGRKKYTVINLVMYCRGLPSGITFWYIVNMRVVENNERLLTSECSLDSQLTSDVLK